MTSISYALEAQLTMSQCSKSFFWARRFLSAQQAMDTAILYAFCRYVDDVADRSLQPLDQLIRIENDLITGHSLIPPVQAYLQLANRLNLPLDIVMVLMKTLQKDQKGMRIKDQAELIRYCYGVASTVGLLMCRVLGVNQEKAYPFAIDLGIGMQLTNISRDVYEDAFEDKIYLPQSAFITQVDPISIVDLDPNTLDQVQRVTTSLLKLARLYYRSGDQGLHYLPAKARLAILLASRLYEAKGDKIFSNPSRFLLQRADTSLFQKVYHTGKASCLFAFHPLYKKGLKAQPHQQALHQAIVDLPGAHRPIYET